MHSQLSREGMEKRDVEAIALVVQRFINDGYQVFRFHSQVFIKKNLPLDGQCILCLVLKFRCPGVYPAL